MTTTDTKTKTLPNSIKKGGSQEKPTNRMNKAKMVRLSVSMPTKDWSDFGNEARARGMSIRRYTYFLWDEFTGNQRAKVAFPDERE